MKALITGINGFVGEYLSDFLISNQIDVYGTVLSEEASIENISDNKIFKMDLLDKNEVNKIIAEIKPDYIFHLAGQSSVALSWKKPDLTINVNVIGTINLLEAVKLYSNKSRVLIIGSSDQYGIVNPEQCPISENTPMNPQSPYATSKKTQEEIAIQYFKAFKINTIIVRAFNHIGPKQNKGFVIADFASQIAEIEKEKKAAIIKVGNLDAKRDFTDVRDVVRAYYLVMTNGKPGEIYNVGSGITYKIKEILDKLLSLAKVSIYIEKDNDKMRPSDVPLIQCDNSKISTECGWTLQYPIDQTLIDTLNYWRRCSS
ncbi:GDP-mannose 4,6-dehydratase [Acetoanaerobium noterae]|uniref:GDP-mannose 4,6-dehydratase n=1 Tax=Acetoanaerobium noterae TaxID=745369 RepID=UPI0028AF0B03|nr:GDP-mannose 4,6-dehydratase [Acetoanaerobium noterae]